MMKRLLTAGIVLVATMANVGARTSTEMLDRGVVAVHIPSADSLQPGGVFISWRILRSDAKGEPFDVYRNGKKLNEEPLTTGGSFFIDHEPLSSGDALYEVRGGAIDGRFLLRPDAPAGYLSIKLEKPEGGIVPKMERAQSNRRPGRWGGWRDDGSYTYSANDASVADVDGDGRMELILKWEPSNAHDNSHDGYCGPTLIDCYKLFDDNDAVDSRLLWRINLGRNIRSGAHYVPFIVYDFDGDGRAELMVKTADATRDGQGNIIGDSLADYRNNRGRILDGPEYISVFDGLTGRVLDSKPYIPSRGHVKDWGDDRGNRSERYLAALAFLGPVVPEAPSSPSSPISPSHPSAIFCRGYYTRSVLAAWDWDGHDLKNRWTFDTNDPEWRSYAGQGNHNLRVADIDGDGFDEITYGSMAVDHDGRGLYNTGMGHGDAIHLVPDAETGHLYIWDCHENKRDGSELRDAATGEVVFQIKSNSDVGRCMAADIDPTNPGIEMWSTDSHGVRNMKGDVIQTATDADDPQHNNNVAFGSPRQRKWLSINFGIWWDGDLLRELLDRETVTKYDWKQRDIVTLQRFEGQFNNGTKSNPCLAADLLGDWREEVVIRNRESTELRIYTTTQPTDHRIDCLLQDNAYRISVATQNVGYNQPSEPGFYLGPDRTDYLK